jgi:hypothetical protein
MSNIVIKFGEYRKQPVVNQAFEMVKGYKVGKKGNYVTVKNAGHFDIDIDEVRVKVNDISDIIFVDGNVGMASQDAPTIDFTPINPETDQEAMDRIATRFQILDEMSSACIGGKIRAMIVSGPPGVGKSFGVQTQLEKASTFDRIAGKPIRFETCKGAMTALGLYSQLYKFSDARNVLVFDDCDSVFMDDLSLNILKAALDSGKKRKICWNSDSRLLRDENIPNSFEFKGSAIFITNLKFENVRSKKLQDHLEALESRCHFLDLTIDSERDKMLRIRQVHRDAPNGLFEDYDFSSDEDDQILQFMENNTKRLRELSIRMAIKIADLIKISPTNWKTLTENTCMRKA